MAINPIKFLKSLLISQDGTLTPASIQITPAGTANTTTTIQSSQTTNKTLTLPDATDTVVARATTDTLSNKTLDNTTVETIKDANLTVQNSSDTTKQLNLSLSGLATSTTASLGVPAFSSDTLVTAAATQTLTNKTIAAGSNTVSGITNSNLSGSAAITNANLASMATNTIKGNNTGGSATPADLTVSQVHTMLGDVTTVGAIDSQTAAANALVISGNNIYTQSASATNPGMVNTTTQTFAGAKTFNNGAVMGAALNMNGQTITNTGTLTLPTSTDTLVGRATTDTLTNKTLSGNTASSLINGSGTININSSGTITVPGATDTLVARATTDTLTNKTIGDALTLAEISTPSNPSASNLKIYSKSDNNLYTLNSSGVETQVGSGSGGLKNYLGTVNNVNGNGNFELGNTNKWSLATGNISNKFPSLNLTSGVAYTNNLYVFTVTSANATIGATYTNNSKTFTVSGTISSGTLLVCTGTGSPSGSGTLTKSTGTGDATISFSAFTITGPASGNLSFSVVSSSQLAGSYSGSLVSSANTVAGDMLISDAVAIDIEDQARVLGFKFYYNVNSGAANGNFSGTNSNTFGVAIYDVANASWIMPAGVYNLTQTSGTGIASGTFQTASNGTKYQLALYCANASSGAITVYVDDFFVGPQVSVNAPAISDWVQYTPTFTGFGTPTGIKFYSRRVGDSLEVNGLFTSGSNTATQAQITLGFNGGNSNVTLDTSKINTDSVLGNMMVNSSSTTYFGAYVISPGANQNYINLSQQTSTTSGFVAANGSAISSAAAISVEFKVPIVGWSSNSVASSDTDTRVVAARYTGATASITSSYSDVTFSTKQTDTHAAYSGATFTVPVSGIYDFGGQVYVSGTASLNGTTIIGITQNGTTIEENDFTYAGAVTGSVGIPFSFGSISCNANDTIKIQIKSSITVPVITASSTENFLHVKRLSGPAVVTATETVAAIYTTNATTSFANNTTTTVNYATKELDTHNAVTTGASWVFTAPVSGLYSVDAVIGWSIPSSSNTQAQITLSKNGSALRVGQTFNATTFGTVVDIMIDISTSVHCNAGDTLSIAGLQNSGGARNLAGNAAENYICITRTGN